MKRIRIMHLAQCAGGVDVYLRILLKHMRKNRFEHILICSHDYHASDYEGIADQFIQIELGNALSPTRDAKAIRETRRLINLLRPDIIYCHSSKAGGVGRLANIGTGIPLLYNPHGWAFNMAGHRRKRAVYLALERILSPLTTRFVTISNFEKLTAVEHRVASSKRIRTIVSGIDLDGVRAQQDAAAVSRAQLHIPEQAYLVGMMGRICETKAPDTFVRMAARTKDLIPEAHFMIVGDGDERAHIEHMIAEAGLTDCFTITGWVSNPLAFANLFDQGVLLSRWEGFGLVLAEYMALGKPVVATEVNAIPDLITDHDNGLLVAVDNDRMAAEAVYEAYKDKALRNSMIEKGKMRVNAFFDVKRTASEHERLFEKTIASNGHMR